MVHLPQLDEGTEVLEGKTLSNKATKVFFLGNPETFSRTENNYWQEDDERTEASFRSPNCNSIENHTRFFYKNNFIRTTRLKFAQKLRTS